MPFQVDWELDHLRIRKDVPSDSVVVIPCRREAVVLDRQWFAIYAAGCRVGVAYTCVLSAIAEAADYARTHAYPLDVSRLTSQNTRQQVRNSLGPR